MTKKSMIKFFKDYKRSSSKARRDYFDIFEKKMIYRTTKTENPRTTKKMVERVLSK